MEGNDPLSQGQAQAEPTCIGGTGAPVERLEYLLDLFGGDDVALVYHVYKYFVIREGEIHYGSFIGGVFTSIFHDVLDSDVEELAVAEYDKILFIFRELAEVELYTVIAIELFDVCGDFKKDLVYPYFVELDTSLGARLGYFQE